MASSLILRGDTAQLYEQPYSPQFSFGDVVSATAVYSGPFTLCLASAPRKGALGLGTFAGLRVAEATVTKRDGGLGDLTIRYEGALADDTAVPADECSVEWADQRFDLENHPKFNALSATTIRNCRAIAEGTDGDGSFAKIPTAERTRAQELIDRLRSQFTEWEIGFPRYVWTTYSLNEPTTDGGGYYEDPYGPLTPPLGFVWLRKSDQLSFNGTYYRLTSTWQAGLSYDPFIYPPEP